MDSLKGCLFQIILYGGWFCLWFLCMDLGKIWNISPFLILVIIVVISIIIAILLRIIYVKIDEKRERTINNIKIKYPNAYQKQLNIIGFENIYISRDKRKILCEVFSKFTEEEWAKKELKEIELNNKFETLKKLCPYGVRQWQILHPQSNYEQIVSNIVEIEQLENNHKLFVSSNKWEQDQKDFSNQCYKLSKELMPTFGRYVYSVNFKKRKMNGELTEGEYKIWQFFPTSICFENDLDYKYFKYIEENAANLPLFKTQKRYFNSFVYDNIISFINELNKEESVLVYINSEVVNWTDEALYYHYQHLLLLPNIKVYYPIGSEFINSENENWLQHLHRRIIIIDMITDNESLKNICEKFLDKGKDKKPLITYISLLKCFDRNEMQHLIDKKNVEMHKMKEVKEAIENMLGEATVMAKTAHIEIANDIIAKAEEKRIEANLAEDEDVQIKIMLTKTKEQLNSEYKDTGFSEEWKELRVDYSSPKEFLQMDNWAYAVSKFPEKGTILYPYRRRKTARTGHIEKYFLEQLREWLPVQIQPIHDICINVSDDSRPYEPDIALFIEGYDTIRIDVEIDEPYAAFSKEPIHYITCGDEYRDDLLNRHGWIVVRFAEKQIKKYPKSCVLYLVKLIKSLVPQMAIPTDLQSVNPLPPMKRWTKNEAIIMAANGEREKYLDHVFSKTEEIKIELADIRLNENERKCQSLVKASAMSIDMTEKMVNFTDSGVYERDKYIDFYPFEHIYIYKGIEQLLPVSSLVAYFFEKFNALEQAERKSVRCHMPVEYYLKLWDKIGKLASEVGTFVHLQTENYFKNGKFETEYQFEYEGKIETINVKKEKEHFLNFIKDFSIIPYRQEWTIYDVDLNIAGTIDLICKEDDGEYSIYDWKRSSKIIDAFGRINVRGFNDKMSFNGINVPDTAYYHYCIQQNLYRYMLEKNYGINIKSMNLVVLCPEYSKYYKVNVPVMDEVIGSIISVCKEKNLGHRLLNK